MLVVKQFDEETWNGMSGCECWNKGRNEIEQPIFANADCALSRMHDGRLESYGTGYTIIADANGVGLYTCNSGGETIVWLMLIELPSQKSAWTFIENFPELITEEWIKEMGFISA